MDTASNLLQDEGNVRKSTIYLASMDRIVQDSTYFVIFELPDHTRVFDWFLSDKPVSSLYDYIAKYMNLGNSECIELLDKDQEKNWKSRNNNETSMAPIPNDSNCNIKEFLRPLHKGSTRTRYLLRVRSAETRTSNQRQKDKMLINVNLKAKNT